MLNTSSAYVHAKSLQSCLTLCNPMDCSPPASSVHEILQARILEWVAIFFSRDLPDPEIEPGSPALQADSSDCNSYCFLLIVNNAMVALLVGKHKNGDKSQFLFRC